MPSQSLLEWQQKSKLALDRVEAAHGAVGGHRRGRRYVTQQINESYVLLLSSHFQLFCRRLHSEMVDHITSAITDPMLRQVVHAAMTTHRKLDHGNPNPSNLAEDFGALGMIKLWDGLKTLDARNATRQVHLEEMNSWRNAIAHQDFSSPKNAKKLNNRTQITLKEIRGFRAACEALAISLDRAALAHIKAIAGAAAGW